MDYQHQPVHPLPGHSRPSGPQLALTVWNAAWPPLLYMTVQVLVSVGAGMAAGLTVAMNPEAAGLTTAQLAEAIGALVVSWVLPVMAVSMILCLAVYIPFYFRFHRGERMRGIAELGAGNLLLIVALTVAAYFAVSALLSFIPQGFGGYEEHIDGLTSGPFLMQLLVVGVGAPVAEELCMRGLTQNRLMRLIPPAPAIVIQAAVFALMHWNIVQSSYAFLLGLLLGWLYYRTRSIWAPILCHVLINSGSTLISEFLATGEAVGEAEYTGYGGSVILLIVSLALTAALIRSLSRRLSRADAIERSGAEGGPRTWDI